ncbi:MAG: hypothetical protein HFH87_15125 [Lachnospiraceae bacterium]|nr:hypothetical protein [Lachnospiraceae bacterium]
MKKYILIAGVMAFYDNTIEFRRFAIYKNGKPIRVSHEVPLWYEKFIENVK